MDITKIFSALDDFCLESEKEFIEEFPDETPDAWPSRLSLSEVMTILVAFHGTGGGYRNFKSFYTLYVQRNMKHLFLEIVSYTRFVELIKLAGIPLFIFLTKRTGKVTGIAFIDSTKLVVCNNKRITSNKVFNELAKLGKSTMGWFYGFKLHLIVNEHGEILSFYLSPGNMDDRKPVPKITKGLWGKLFGDKGYISHKLSELLLNNGLQLLTPLKKNMKNKLIPLNDKILLRKRSIIETINDVLKNSCHIEHTRHRSPVNFLVNLLAGLIGYSYREKLPKINFTNKEICEIIPGKECVYLS